MPKTQMQQSEMTPTQVKRTMNAAWVDGLVYAWNEKPETAIFGRLMGHDTDEISGLVFFEIADFEMNKIGDFFNVRAERLGHPVGEHPTRKR